MNQLVLRTVDSKTFEVLEADGFGKYTRLRRKTINTESLIDLLSKINPKQAAEKVIFTTNIYEQEENLVSYTKTTEKEIYVYDFKEQYIRTFYQDKYYKVLHPKSFIKVAVCQGKIQDMYIYPYKENTGLSTKLFSNPFPNGYTGNRTCIGTADRKVKKGVYSAIIGILETEYTHSYTNFKNSFLKETNKAFEYLAENPFPYNKLASVKKKLKDILVEGGSGYE